MEYTKAITKPVYCIAPVQAYNLFRKLGERRKTITKLFLDERFEGIGAFNVEGPQGVRGI